MAKKTDNFNCYVDVRGKATNPEDDGLAGVYLVSVSASKPVDLGGLTAIQKHRISAAVLDEFHGHQGIEEVDDFSVSVYLENGLEIGEDDEPGGINSAFSVRADHCGSVDFDSLPEVLSFLAEDRDDEINLLNIDFYIDTAKQHGEDSEPDHEVGDLQDLLRAMWELLPSAQRIAFARGNAVQTMLEGAAPGFVDDGLEDELEALSKMHDASLEEASDALEKFLEVESNNDGTDGLAYEIASSLKAEADEGGATALQNLPALKQAILDYALEQADSAGGGDDE